MICRTVPILVFFTLCVLPAARQLYGQERFTGIVVDSASLSALPGVSIQVKGAFRGTTTDERGNFSIQASRSDTLVFTLVGYDKLELPLLTYEAGMVRMSERYTMLQAITIDEYKRQDLYEGMFDERNAQLKPRIPFYLSKEKKEKIKVGALRNENERVQTYVDVIITNPEFKMGMMQKYSLTEEEYYGLLRGFNERHHEVMYYLTRAELLSLLNTYFETQAVRR